MEDLSKSKVDGEDIIVTITEGKVKGTIMHNKKGRTFFAFLAIPYAIPPVGNLRFKVNAAILFLNLVKCQYLGAATYRTLE